MAATAYTKPLSLPQTAWRRRLEVFSPKLERRVSLGSYDAWRCWVALEANPSVIRFCERPARMAGSGSAMIDFWVQLKGDPRGEFWRVERSLDADGHGDTSASPDPLPSTAHDRAFRSISAAQMASWEVPIANWARILPYLVSFRRFREPLLEQSLVVRLARFTRLHELLEHFPQRDPSDVQAALFSLLANGRVVSPDIANAPLGGATRFRRA